MVMQIEISDTFKKIWGLMLKSKASASPADSVWDGLVRVNQLTSDYIKEFYGPAAIEFNGRYYTPDCIVFEEKKPATAADKRAAILAERKNDTL